MKGRIYMRRSCVHLKNLQLNYKLKHLSHYQRWHDARVLYDRFFEVILRRALSLLIIGTIRCKRQSAGRNVDHTTNISFLLDIICRTLPNTLGARREHIKMDGIYLSFVFVFYTSCRRLCNANVVQEVHQFCGLCITYDDQWFAILNMTRKIKVITLSN